MPLLTLLSPFGSAPSPTGPLTHAIPEPANLDLELWIGATFRKRIMVYTTPSKTTPRNLIGYRATFVTDAETPFQAVFLDASTIDIYAPVEVTSDITWASTKYELYLTSLYTGEIESLLYGVITTMKSGAR
jgi:hypothetical protein